MSKLLISLAIYAQQVLYRKEKGEDERGGRERTKTCKLWNLFISCQVEFEQPHLLLCYLFTRKEMIMAIKFWRFGYTGNLETFLLCDTSLHVEQKDVGPLMANMSSNWRYSYQELWITCLSGLINSLNHSKLVVQSLRQNCSLNFRNRGNWTSTSLIPLPILLPLPP